MLQVSKQLEKLAPREPAPPAPQPEVQPAAEPSASAAAPANAGDADVAGDGAADMDATESAPLLGDQQQAAQQPAEQPPPAEQSPEQPAVASPLPEPLSPEDQRYLGRYKRLREIISGALPISLHLDFMYSHNHADLQILKNMKAAVEV